MKLPQDKTKEELISEIEQRNQAFKTLLESYESLQKDFLELKKELKATNESAINFEKKVETLLGKEALGIVMYGSKEAYERMMAIEERLSNAKTPAERNAAFEDLMAYESDDPFDKTLLDDEQYDVEQE